MKRLAVGLLAVSVLAGGCRAGQEPSAGPAPAPSVNAPAAVSGPDAATPDAATPDAATPGAATPDAATPVVELTWSPCQSGFECAVLPVTLDETAPSGDAVELAVTRRPVTDPADRIGSLVINPGGPGASAVDYLQAAWRSVPEPVRRRFDLVAFDPRGVGRSAPVRCGTTAELDRYFALDPSPDSPREQADLQAGNASLVAGCAARSGETLPHVSTRDAAADLDALRAALGDERLTYLGYSYGTSLGAAYLDRYPTRVRAMVLDGGIDPTLTWDELLEGQSTGFDRALEAFLADCERTRCAFRDAVDGDLGQAYDRLAAQVEQTPLRADPGRPVGPGEFSLGVGAGLYSQQSGWPAIAGALAAAEDGDGRWLLALNDDYLQRGADGYANITEANFAVNCLDRPWPREPAPYLALAERVRQSAPRFGPAIALSGLACSVWPVPPVGRPRPVTAPGAPPVVVIGTTGDPATPYAWSVALADQLVSGVLVTFRGDGHTVYRDGASPCLRGPVDDYLLTGAAPGPLTC